MYKNETETLQKLLNERTRSNSSPHGGRGRSSSPTVGHRTAARRDIATSPVMSSSRRSGSNGSVSPTRCTVCGINRHRSSPTKVRSINQSIERNRNSILILFQEFASYDNQLKSLEEERDRLRRELTRYRRSSRETVLISIDHRSNEQIHFRSHRTLMKHN